MYSLPLTYTSPCRIYTRLSATMMGETTYSSISTTNITPPDRSTRMAPVSSTSRVLTDRKMWWSNQQLVPTSPPVRPRRQPAFVASLAVPQHVAELEIIFQIVHIATQGRLITGQAGACSGRLFFIKLASTEAFSVVPYEMHSRRPCKRVRKHDVATVRRSAFFLNVHGNQLSASHTHLIHVGVLLQPCWSPPCPCPGSHWSYFKKANKEPKLRTASQMSRVARHHSAM